MRRPENRESLMDHIEAVEVRRLTSGGSVLCEAVSEISFCSTDLAVSVWRREVSEFGDSKGTDLTVMERIQESSTRLFRYMVRVGI